MRMSLEPLNIPELSIEDNSKVLSRIRCILESWEGTPYVAGWGAKQAGTDCVRFVSGVLDELYRRDTELERLPQDASFHNKTLCQSALRKFLGRYEHVEVENNVLQPGDIIIAGPNSGGPGHAMIAGWDCLWHCDSSSVTRTGLIMPNKGAYFFKKAYRGYDRKGWL